MTSRGLCVCRRVARRGGFFKITSVLLALLGGAVPAATAQVPPDEDWRTLETDHFRVTYPDRMNGLAPRIGAIAERAHTRLAAAFLQPPRGKIDLLVTDATDYSNGFAQVTPSNRITIYARPPVDDLGLGYFDDWMELVVTHELAHVFHLDRTGRLGALVRGIFGRVATTWPVFPGLGVPRWTIEGLATWYESHLTDAGRIHGTYHDMLVRTGALEGRLEGLDQAAGDSPLWPGGVRYYAYGASFFDYLLDKYGEERMGDFAAAVAGQWVPYRLDAAGREAFGSRLSEEWRLWADGVEGEARAVVADLEDRGLLTRPETVTRGARVGLYPRLSREGGALAFTWSDGRSDSKIRVVDPVGGARAWDARTNGIATFDWLPGGDLLVAQFELDGPYRVYSDLYRFSADGDQERLTWRERLSFPSSGPDGRWAVAVQEGDGTNTLVRVDLATGEVSPIVPREPDVHWTHPAVSPDGRWIAASRWRLGGYLDVVVLDGAGGVVLELTRDRAMDLAPAWSPDGSRVLWSSDRTEMLNLFAASVDPEAGESGPIRMVTHVPTGVAYPSVDPGGRWIYFSGYHVDGWEVERVPFETQAWGTAPEPSTRFAPNRPPPDPEPLAGEHRPYSALPTLTPRYWEPLYKEPVVTSPVQTSEIQLRSRQLLGAAVGAETSGRDLVGRHVYDAWARVFTSGGKVEGGGAYSWAGLGNPVLSLSASQFWGEGGARFGSPDDGQTVDTLFVRTRRRDLSGSVTFLRPQWRRSFSLSLGGGVTWEMAELLDNRLEPATRYALTRPNRRFADARVSLTLSSARSYAFQTGGADGASLFMSARTSRELTVPDSLAGAPGGDGSVDDVLGRLRLFKTLGGPGHASHVVAARVSAGAARGPGARAGYFQVGGASGREEDVTGLGLFGGRSIFFPVRGYPQASRFGRFAWSLSAEYRFPLWLVHRGLGAWPLYLDRVVGSVFLDAGNAWGPELDLAGFNSPRLSTLTSAGVEVSTSFLTLWKEPLLLRAGVGVPLEAGAQAQVYLRVGLSF